jgi:hypothetical protein
MGGRGVIRLKFVHAFRDRYGRMRYYFRRYGKRTALPGLPGSSEFMAAYAIQIGEISNRVAIRPKPAPGTFAALAIRYFGSPQYQSRTKFFLGAPSYGTAIASAGPDARNRPCASAL